MEVSVIAYFEPFSENYVRNIIRECQLEVNRSCSEKGSTNLCNNKVGAFICFKNLLFAENRCFD